MSFTTLTTVEIAAGLNLDEVTHLAGRALVRDGGRTVVVETDAGPMAASAAARLRLNRPVAYAGMNALGHAVYHVDTDVQVMSSDAPPVALADLMDAQEAGEATNPPA